MSGVAAVIARPHTGAGFVRWPLMVLALIGLGTFGLLTLYAAGHVYMPFDVSLERWVQGVSWGPLVTVFYSFDWLEGTRQIVAGIAVILVVSAFNWKNAPLMLFAAAATAVYTVTELAIQRPRPTADLVRVLRHTGSYSYPSGHMVFFSWAVVLLVVGLLFGRAPRLVVAAAWVVAALVLVAAAIGRIYLGEHWPSDVIAGLALGIGWTALVLSIRPLSNPALARSK
ncbi:MAG TPA: phosphatase PAP2 family protein [Candidatus Baltobacterales bacterium]|nr:phosphatase PAP2 family protein [Candidatus Baltobacterales bacterium]